MAEWKLRCPNCGDVTVFVADDRKKAEWKAKTKCENCGGATRELLI